MAKKTRVTNTIRTLRFMTGEMTQQQLADRVGVTRQTILAVENGKYSPTLDKPLEDVFSMPEEE